MQQNRKNYRSITKTGLISILVSNIYIIVGVLLLSWNAYVVFYSFIIELVILSLFTIITILFAQKLFDPYFSKLNPYWVKNYPTKWKFISMLMPFIVVFATLISVLGIWFSWNLAKTDISAHLSELLYYILIVVLTNIAHILFYIGKKKYETTYISEVFRNYMTSKILPLFLSLFILAFVFKYSKIFVIIIVILKFGVNLLTYLNEEYWLNKTSN
jgi:hypothetical protein